MYHEGVVFVYEAANCHTLPWGATVWPPNAMCGLQRGKWLISPPGRLNESLPWWVMFDTIRLHTHMSMLVGFAENFAAL